MLPDSDLPTHYYNIAADLPEPLPSPLHPGTREPIGPEMLAPLFPMELIKQEVSAERFIEIPEPVREAYRIYRPSPLIRALGLERALDTPARIYYKNEGVSPAGSHKPNTAVAQAYYNQAEGIQPPDDRDRRRPVGERPGLRRGLFGIETKVFMVRVSYEQKPYRRSFIETFGGRSWPRRRPRRTPVARSWPRTRTRPAAWGSRSARRSRRRPAARTRSTRSAAS